MADTTDSKAPWWSLFKPDIRLLVTIGYFALAFRLLYMIEGHAELLKDAAFMTIATMIVGSGGLGIIASFLFGASKVEDKAQPVAIKQPDSEPVPVVDVGPTGP